MANSIDLKIRYIKKIKTKLNQEKINSKELW